MRRYMVRFVLLAVGLGFVIGCDGKADDKQPKISDSAPKLQPMKAGAGAGQPKPKGD